MILYLIIAFVVGVLGGWIYAGFPLPRRPLTPPAKSKAREIGESTVIGSHILRDGVTGSRLPGCSSSAVTGESGTRRPRASAPTR